MQSPATYRNIDAHLSAQEREDALKACLYVDQNWKAKKCHLSEAAWAEVIGVDLAADELAILRVWGAVNIARSNFNHLVGYAA